MKVRICSIKNRESLPIVFGQEYSFSNKIYFPSFALKIKDISAELISKIKIVENNLGFQLNWFGSNSSNQDCVLIGDLNLFFNFSSVLNEHSAFELSESIISQLDKYEKAQNYEYVISNRIFSGKENYVMGVLNLTKDSFYDGGKYFSTELAILHAEKLIREGVDIIDIGAESTRPGSKPISAEEELNRIIPVLSSLKQKNIVISVDTYKSFVAEEVLKNGAHIINDISGLKFDPKTADIIAEFSVPVIIMHIRGTPKDMQINPSYSNVVNEIFDEIEEQVHLAELKGIKEIFIDPGIGFGKRLRDNYEILNRLNEFLFIGYPIVIGASRKSFIGKVLNQNPEERLIGTITANAAAQITAANIFRVHDVKEMNEVKKIINFIKNPGLLSF